MLRVITEAITIGTILGGSAAVAWIAKTKFHSEIEADLAAIEAKEETIVPRNDRHKTH